MEQDTNGFGAIEEFHLL